MLRSLCQHSPPEQSGPPGTEAALPPCSVLDEAQQRALFDHVVVCIAERMVASEEEGEVLMRIRNALAFLVDMRKREMVREDHGCELRVLLTAAFDLGVVVR